MYSSRLGWVDICHKKEAQYGSIKNDQAPEAKKAMFIKIRMIYELNEKVFGTPTTFVSCGNSWTEGTWNVSKKYGSWKTSSFYQHFFGTRVP